MNRMGWDMMGLYEQNRVLVIDTKVLFYTQSDLLGHLAWNFKTKYAEGDDHPKYQQHKCNAKDSACRFALFHCLESFLLLSPSLLS
jgi:hypothetical protein